jgi:hypothetical protein
MLVFLVAAAVLSGKFDRWEVGLTVNVAALRVGGGGGLPLKMPFVFGFVSRAADRYALLCPISIAARIIIKTSHMTEK